MKKLLVALVALIAFSANAQQNAAAIKLGVFTPKACETGFIVGYEQGRHIDENLDVAISIDWFKKDFEDKTKIKSESQVGGNLSADINQKVAETTIYDFPVMLSLTAKFPVAHKTKVYATGGFGAELLYASYHNYVSTTDVKEEKKFAFDWNWRLGGGALYQLGDKSEIFGELTFHYSIPDYENEYKVGSSTIIETTEYDMYGLLSRVGVRYYF